MLVAFLIEWFYPVLFEVLRAGRTPGKAALGLRVVNANATPIGWNASLIRNLLRTVDFLPLLYLGGLVSMLLTQRFQRLGDLAADTLVVHAGHPAVGAGEPEEVAAGLGARPAPIALAPAEQRALLAFAERRGALSPERAVELADILEPLARARGDEGLATLLRIANGIAGRS